MAGGPRAAQGSRASAVENGDLIPLYSFCALTTNGEESLGAIGPGHCVAHTRSSSRRIKSVLPELVPER